MIILAEYSVSFNKSGVMIPTKTRESKRLKTTKLPKNLERMYKEGKCRDCAVVITRMDFAKILGKFTKVKIQYESSTTPKTKRNFEDTSPISNARLKRNENGMVLIHRNAYNQHPVKQLQSPKKAKINETNLVPNILKENNRLKKPVLKENKSKLDIKKLNHSNLKLYGIIFEDPMDIDKKDMTCKTSLSDLLPFIDNIVLPSDEWCIDYFPKNEEPKDDKVYDRIAAELEDLMYSEKPVCKTDEKTGTKPDDFPSIMDILNDNSNENKTNNTSSSPEFKSNLESSDVEAMLLGKVNSTNDTLPTPMDVDSSVIGNLVDDVSQLNAIQSTITPVDDKLPPPSVPEEFDNPNSPSILDEALQKGIEEHLPAVLVDQPKEISYIDTEAKDNAIENSTITKLAEDPSPISEELSKEKDVISTATTENEGEKEKPSVKEKSKEAITHVVFKKSKNGTCCKSVTCPKNLKYGIEFEGKSVEFLGAPKFVSSLEDLQVLLEIVHESDLNSLYVLQ